MDSDPNLHHRDTATPEYSDVWLEITSPDAEDLWRVTVRHNSGFVARFSCYDTGSGVLRREGGHLYIHEIILAHTANGTNRARWRKAGKLERIHDISIAPWNHQAG